MANTYYLLGTTTVGSGGTATVTFSSISSSYTDLLLKASVRNTRSAGEAELRWTVNSSAVNYGNRLLQGNGSTVSSSTTGTTYFYSGEINAATSTASVFGSTEIYIPNYASANYKQASSESLQGSKTSTAYQTLTQGLWSDTAAITSIAFYYSSGDWVEHSTFYLYGISNT